MINTINGASFYLCVIVMIFSCNDDRHIRTYRLLKSANDDTPEHIEKSSRTVKKLIWEKPEKWLKNNGSPMRLVSLSVPYENSLGDLSVIELSGNGGGIVSNVNRWRQQLNLAHLTLSQMQKYITNHSGKLGQYDVIHIVNEDSGDAFICAILPHGDKTLFVKLSIKAEHIKKINVEFINFCSSLNYSF